MYICVDDDDGDDVVAVVVVYVCSVLFVAFLFTPFSFLAKKKKCYLCDGVSCCKEQQVMTRDGPGYCWSGVKWSKVWCVQCVHVCVCECACVYKCVGLVFGFRNRISCVGWKCGVCLLP